MFLSIIAGMIFAIITTAYSAETNVITKENPAVVIRVAFSGFEFKKGLGGVHTAAPIKDKDGYILYDVIVWKD